MPRDFLLPSYSQISLRTFESDNQVPTVYLNSQILDISSYFVDKPPISIIFKSFKRWRGFGDMVVHNLSRAQIRDSESSPVLRLRELWRAGKVEDVDNLLENIASSASITLERNGVKCYFTAYPGAEQVGRGDLNLFLENSEYASPNRPCLIGIHCLEGAELLQKDEFFDCMVRSENTVKVKDREVYSNVRELINHMIVNNLRYGYISTGTVTRFFRRIDNTENCVEFSEALNLTTSKPYSIAGCFKGMVLQCQFGEDRLGIEGLISRDYNYHMERRGLGYPLQCEILNEPDVRSFKKTEIPFPGKRKWWRVKKMREFQYQIRFSKPGQLPSALIDLPDTWGINCGTLYTSPRTSGSPGGVTNSTNTKQAVFKCCNYNGRGESERYHQILNEASIYEYLEGKGLNIVPVRYVFGDVHGFLKVLVLEPVGRAIHSTDLSDCNIAKIRLCVDTLHSYKVIHGDIRLDNFCIDEAENIRVINFAKSKLYSRLYESSAQKEIEQVDNMISQALSVPAYLDEAGATVR
jgi:hypothetical protein